MHFLLQLPYDSDVSDILGHLLTPVGLIFIAIPSSPHGLLSWTATLLQVTLHQQVSGMMISESLITPSP